MAVGPKFGSAGRSSRYSIDQSADRLDLKDGFNTELYFRKLNDSRSETVEKLLSYGIEARATNPFGATLQTVTHSQNEDVVMHESWEPLREANTDATTQGGALVAVDAMLKTQAEERWTVSGYGKVPFVSGGAGAIWKVGDYTTVDLVIDSATTVVSATDAVNITIPAGAFLESVRSEGENTAFNTFNLEFVKYTAQPDPTRPWDDIILGADSASFENADIDFVATGYWYKISRTTTLTAEGFATVETSVELHEKHTNPIATPAAI